MDFVAFELDLGNWIGDGILTSGTVPKAWTGCTGDHCGGRMTENGGNEVGRK